MDQVDYYYYSSSNVKKSGQIPVFGNWDFTNDVPITQYFECARQPGVGRYSSSSGECDPHSTDLYSVAGAQKAPRRTVAVNAPASQKSKPSAKRVSLVNRRDAEKKKVPRPAPPVRPVTTVQFYPVPSKAKAVDEDLYKIPPELLHHSSSTKKKLWFISRCLVPACSA